MPGSPYSIRRLFWVGPALIFIAGLVDLVFFAVTRAFGEQYLLPLDGGITNLYPLTALMLIISVLLTGIVATAFFGLLLRYSKKPVTVFVSVAITALILSFGGPIYTPNVALQTKLLLCGMETIPAVIVTVGLLLMSHQKVKIP